jgi:hypothetical protein
MNSILYILFSKFLATIYVSLFWKQFIRTEFQWEDAHKKSYRDSIMESDIDNENFLRNATLYFLFYWFNRQFFIVYTLVLFIGIFFFGIPF